MRDYIRAKSFALSIVVNLLLVLVVALFIVPKIIMDREEEQFYVVDLQSDWSPDSEEVIPAAVEAEIFFPTS